jgi:ATP-dependent Clp protease ATP-binding subunit ClpA
MFELFTDRARRVLVLAQEEARLLGHSFIGAEHLLIGLIDEGEGIAARALESLGISLQAVRERVEETIGPVGSHPTGSPPFTPRAKKVLELSQREALQLGHNFVGTEHLLLGLVREGDGVAAQVLVSLGVDLTRVRQQVIQLLSGYQGREERGEPRLAPIEHQRVEPTAVPIGDSWTVHVVRAGRTPAVFAEAYQALADLATGRGVDIDELLINVTSIETHAGPGLQLWVRHELPGEPSPTRSDEADEANDNESPT